MITEPVVGKLYKITKSPTRTGNRNCWYQDYSVKGIIEGYYFAYK